MSDFLSDKATVGGARGLRQGRDQAARGAVRGWPGRQRGS